MAAQEKQKTTCRNPSLWSAVSAGHMFIVSMFLPNEVKNSEERIAQVVLFPVIVSRGQYTIS